MSRGLVALTLLAVCAAAGISAHQSQTPVFRGSTEIVVVDVQVTDRAGEPLDGLKAGDFSLWVDGKARAIATADFWRLGNRPATVKSDAFSTLASTNPVSAESYVLFVVDPTNMRSEPARILFDQSAEFMSKLEPAHAVGLKIIPFPGLQHQFGTVRPATAKTLGSLSGGFGGKQRRTEEFATRTGLETGIAALKQVDGRRTLVYFGDYLPDDRKLLEDLAREANLADVAIYVVASDAIVMQDVTSRRPKELPPVGGDFGGLEVLAETTGGRFFRRVVTGAIVLPKIARALSAHYVLTFNVESSDKNGKPHAIDVKVNRQDVDVRFRKQFAR